MSGREHRETYKIFSWNFLIEIFSNNPNIFPVHLRRGFCEERDGHPGAAVLGHAHQHCRHGHAQVKNSSR